MLTTLVATAAQHPLLNQHLLNQHWGGPWGGPGWLFLLIPLFWVVVIALVVTLVGRRRRAAWRAGGFGPGFGPGFPGHGQWGGGHAAEQTLAERFAQGDIDEVEYRARLEVLRANRPGQGG
jgi:putative membrane protein